MSRMFVAVLSQAVFLFCISTPVLAQKADAEVSVAEGVLAYDQKRYADALNLFLRGIELDSSNVRAHYYTGLTYLALQQPEQAIGPLEEANRLRPADRDIQFQLGVAYFSIQDYDRAGPILEEVYSEDPDRENLGYYIGLTRYRNKSYSEAVEAFEQTKTDDLNLQQLTRFYRGLAKGVLGLPQQAISELEAAQKIQAVSPITSAAVRLRDELLAQRRVTEAKRFRAQVSIGGFYDDNVAVNPNPATVGNMNQQVILNGLRSRKTTSPGLLTSVLMDYAFFRDGPIEITGTYSFFQTLNFNNHLDNFNLQNHLGGVGGFYRGTVHDVPYQVSLQYSYDYLFLDLNAFLARHTVTPGVTLVPPTFTLPGIGPVGNLFTGLYRFQDKEFFREFRPQLASESRDGRNHMVGFVHVFRFATDKLLVRFGYQYDHESTDGTAFSYSGNRFQTGAQVALPWGDLSVIYDYDVHWRAYENSQVLFTNREGGLSPRYDIQQNHLVQVVKPLPGNLKLTLQYLRIRNTSRIPIYDYTKNVVTGLITWTY